METDSRFNILSNSTDKTLEEQLGHQKLAVFLILSDLTECHSYFKRLVSGNVAIIVVIYLLPGLNRRRRGERITLRRCGTDLPLVILREAFAARLFVGAAPPIDLRAVCLVLAILTGLPVSQRENNVAINVAIASKLGTAVGEGAVGGAGGGGL